MSDRLREFCNKNNIQLIYTNNKYKAASINIHDNLPKLRVHKIFKDCPKDIADAVISFYIKFKNINISKKTIEDYLSDNHPSEEFYLTLPDEDIKSFFVNQAAPALPDSLEDKDLRELNILNISQIDFKGNHSEIGVNDFMSIDEGDLLEVNITINEL